MELVTVKIRPGGLWSLFVDQMEVLEKYSISEKDKQLLFKNINDLVVKEENSINDKN